MFFCGVTLVGLLARPLVFTPIQSCVVEPWFQLSISHSEKEKHPEKRRWWKRVGARKERKPKSEMVVSFHCEETSLYRRHYHWCGTVLHRKTWLPPFQPPPPFKDACQQHINNTRAGAPNRCQVHRQEAATATCFLSPTKPSLHNRTTQWDTANKQRFRTWIPVVCRTWPPAPARLEETLTPVWSYVDVYLWCTANAAPELDKCTRLSVWLFGDVVHCMCTLHGIPLLYHSHAIVRWPWMGWDFYCLGSVT